MTAPALIDWPPDLLRATDLTRVALDEALSPPGG
jgi:hypothetical protein